MPDGAEGNSIMRGRPDGPAIPEQDDLRRFMPDAGPLRESKRYTFRTDYIDERHVSPIRVISWYAGIQRGHDMSQLNRSTGASCERANSCSSISIVVTGMICVSILISTLPSALTDLYMYYIRSGAGNATR